jgi:transposase-like protein
LAEAAFDQPAGASLQGEVKRRANVVGIFPNETSVKRLVGAILLEQNDEWQLQHRYMTLETMNGLSDDPIGTLPSYAIKAA